MIVDSYHAARYKCVDCPNRGYDDDLHARDNSPAEQSHHVMTGEASHGLPAHDCRVQSVSRVKATGDWSMVFVMMIRRGEAHREKCVQLGKVGTYEDVRALPSYSRIPRLRRWCRHGTFHTACFS